jgi:hypothetical protein
MKINRSALLGTACALLLGTASLPPHRLHAQGDNQQRVRTCGTDEGHERLLRTDPEYRRNHEQHELFTKAYERQRASEDDGARAGIVIIPVVVHVLFRTAAENISDAQIISQIDVLNRDYRRLNVDAASVPAVFAPVAADARIQFQLARRDPTCMPTDGITRTATTVTAFDDVSENIKFTSAGGRDAWPRDKYLNIWLGGNIVRGADGSTLLGYARRASVAANIDGVVIASDAFGDVAAPGSSAFLLDPTFNRGRTATHEVGHWLNVNHTFQGGCVGNNAATCGTAGDLVCDTPADAAPTYGCPSGAPANTCTDSPTDNPDQTMNFMDYVNDACMFMFTTGQSLRMDATLYGPRSPIVGSDGHLPPPASPDADLWSLDTPDDVGAQPNLTSSVMWTSDDIWVRNQNDGVTNQEHQPPEFRVPGSPTSFVYVRIRNRGCSPAMPATVRLYWAKASTGLSWPSPWNGSVTSPALMGNPLGTQTTPTIPGGGFAIVAFPWSPPNPADYASFGADRSHFCLLSRIETSATPPFGMASAETADLNGNVKNNNNIVWKNIQVMNDLPGSEREEGLVTVANFGDQPATVRLVFNAPKGGMQESAFQLGAVKVDLGKQLYQRWKDGGSRGEGVGARHGRTITLRDGASLDNLKLDPKELHTIKFTFKPARRVKSNHVFGLDVVQFAADGAGERLVGGQHFTIKTVYRKKRRCWLVEWLHSVFH